MKILKYVKTDNWEGLIFEDNNKIKITSGVCIWNLTADRENKITEVNKNEINFNKLKNTFKNNFKYHELNNLLEV